MTTPFLLEIPPRGMIEEIGLHSRRQLIGYHGDEDRSRAIAAVLSSVEEYVRDNRIPTIAAALEDCPELCEIASVIHVIRGTRDMDQGDALGVFAVLRSSANPEWMRAMAGREMLSQDLATRDQPAICDALEAEPCAKS